MSLNDIPVVRLEIESMKEKVAYHIGLHQSEVSDAIMSAMDRAVASYDFEQKVEAVVHKVLTEEIDHYYRFGKGAAAIKEAVRESFRKASSCPKN